MTWHDKVLWTEGMFLQPQHFQQHERHLTRTQQRLLSALVPFMRGYVALEIDEAGLQQGQLVLTAARGVLPDGTPFDVPGDDPAPAALDIPADARDELVLLGVALTRQGVPESDVEDRQASMPARLHAVEVEVADCHAASLRQAPVQLGRLNLRLLLARDAGEGFATLGVARVLERRADGRVLLDRDYIPPTLHVGGQRTLDGFLREIAGQLHQRGEALAARLAQPGRAGVGEIADFLMLQLYNRAEPELTALQQHPLAHPSVLYEQFVGLAGELSTFRESRRPPPYPAYQHDDPQPCFAFVMADLRQLLSMVAEQAAFPIDLQERKYGIRVGLIPDLELQRSAQFVLAANANMPGDALRSRFPAQAKIGPAERIRDLVTLQLPGVPLRVLPVAPRQIPFHAGFTYFELDTRGSELWRQLESSRGLAIHVAGEFPSLELELWAIRA
ncbi:type VI secretion system baseplate subunit TssK [Ramlibacter sp. AW1]|uniref:Type VI secretion system baseplate subunit TssK n=1 Tax=Ramlibacter aurantiacus TaxID=2801330 RepID=A0A936ZGW2_9BURK|nr:type VI secretion system baseplate subunit TssK [Ramlibacter aurantiacus]MBL0419627.1 type VI secretion system baseplate subunit TssK [Ramlibacter aurantiacus]